MVTTPRPVRTDTKKFRAAADKYVAAIIAVLERYNATKTPDACYEYTLNTPAGVLRVSPSTVHIAQSFDDVEAGKLASKAVAFECNPHSGKWNYGALNSEILADPIEAMGYWERSIDKLMSIPYGWQSFAERLAKWKEVQRCPPGYSPIPGTNLAERAIG
jgi:hypothetical protein